jgi:cysteine desulfurase
MPVYLDHAATSPIRPEVAEEFARHLGVVGNPSSIHAFGQGARRLVEEAREQLAVAVGCNRNEVVFTSGGTESDNLAVKGLYWQRVGADDRRRVIVTAETEHHAILDACQWLERHDEAELAFVPVDARGALDLAWLAEFLVARGSEIALISLMWANNETGVVSDIPTVVALAAEHGIPVHSDAVAAFGHIPIDFAASGLAAMSITAHKIGGPVGIGALIVSRATKMTALLHGGGHERGMRSGSLNAPASKAFALAAELAVAEVEARTAEFEAMRDRLIAGVLSLAPDAVLTRADAPGLPNNAHFTFAGCTGDSLLFLLDMAGVSISTGSACTAGVPRASHVVMATGRTENEAIGSMRVTLGWNTTDDDVDALLAALPEAYAGAKKAGLNAR